MPELSRIGSDVRNPNAKVRVARRAGQQFGRVSTAQLVRLGVGKATVGRWVADGYLQPRLPGVYAVGHTAPSIEADLSEALLYAGRGAMLSHRTAMWWLGILTPQPKVVDVSVPGRRRPRPSLRVHGERRLIRTFHNGLPTTTAAQALLDYAATARLNDLRYALAEAEYRELLRLDEIATLLGRGKRGSAKLRKAIERHQPRLAHTRSHYERQLLYICESADLAIPEINARIGWMTADAVWWEQRLIVEIDGYGGHRTPAQLARDRRRELHARRHGFMTIRYYGEQLFDEPGLVQADLRRALNLTRSERSA
jgi:very-short-patch-repair endonuclease